MRNEAALSEDSIIEEEAAEWVARRMGNENFDRDGFENWRKGDPRRSITFDTMWDRIMGSSLGDALAGYDRRRQETRRAALVAGVAATVIGLSSYQAMPTVQLWLQSPQVYSAGGEGVRMVRLEDGTEIDLAPGAGIEVRYTDHDRDVRLQRGTLFARVARDSSRPLRVHAGDGEVTVLGTRFEVARRQAGVHVAVEEGHVSFGRSGWFETPISLTARQSAMLTDNGLSRDADSASDRIARWRDEWVDYREASLTMVVADLQSLSDRPIRIASGELGDLRVSGRIRLVDPVRQLENLSIVHGFFVRENADAIVISRE